MYFCTKTVSYTHLDLAQLEAQVSTDRYQLVTAQATLEDYKLQLKQLLELDGENEMNIYLPALSDENVLAPLPTKKDDHLSSVSRSLHATYDTDSGLWHRQRFYRPVR